ncbi:DNA cytosine methyltransferase [Tengunoibacter tsumagoiensis]|uniref:DNA (cytosine-5-)-methyltransferase n=1 Tax=Tengunoibacter tsumagoiensis TaxID=2014871 RepID=A0A402A894_9CHLR|nr:DNA cytosine methyltransferase [Tengunoibacter tsumagoiensis]GCE15308.1 DNA cytosine methyltransferase [Tengunoibacter tsumagoiensis]
MTLDITVTDMFCGAGGSSTGAMQAGVTVRLAINHWKRAVETHHTNHPHTRHVLTDLHQANPRQFPATTLLIASPECTSHSLAKGRKRKGQGQMELWEQGDVTPVDEAEERSRCTMWTPLDWAECHGYEGVILENVVDALLWKPFHAWLQAWRSLGYDYKLVYFNSMYAHPTPQSRDRMYFIAWKRKNRRPNLKITPTAYCPQCGKDVASVQCWKNPQRQYGKYKQQYVYRCPLDANEVTPYYYAAANAIDWDNPAPRIGDRAKPLRPKTMKRIAYGLEKFAQEPFLCNLNHPDARPAALFEQPFPTQTAYDSNGITVPPFILDHLGEYRPRALSSPTSTMCASGNHHSLVVPPTWLMTYYNHGKMAPVQDATPTVTTLARHALVVANTSGIPAVEDCGFRMLTPKEIQAAMAFPNTYIVTGTRREQVKQLGNAVTPPVMFLLTKRMTDSLC